MKFTQGSIILIPFPFTNQRGNKVRPALIVSTNTFNKHSKDIWVTGVTTQDNPNQLKIPLTKEDIVVGNLEKESYIKYSIIFAVEKTLVIKKLAELKKHKTQSVIDGISSILGVKEVRLNTL